MLRMCVRVRGGRVASCGYVYMRSLLRLRLVTAAFDAGARELGRPLFVAVATALVCGNS